MNDIESARRPRTAVWVAVVVAILLAATVVFVLVRGGGPHTVRFEVSSSGEKVSSITYGAGEQLGKDVGTAAAAPWSKAYEVTDTSGQLWLHVLSPAGGAITCTIWLDGRIVVESTALSGVTCDIPFDDALDS